MDRLDQVKVGGIANERVEYVDRFLLKRPLEASLCKRDAHTSEPMANFIVETIEGDA